MTDRSRLAALVPRLADARVLCIGDAMLDRFVYGDVERVSPEAPIPVLAVTRESAMAGGAGNVAANLAALGASTHVVTVIGTDRAGDTLASILASIPGAAMDLGRDDSRPTTVKTRYLAGSQQLLRADIENVAAISDTHADAALTAALGALEACGAVILSDYGKGVLRDDIVTAVIAAARRRNLPVVVDPKGRDYRRYRGASLVTPNRRELSEAIGSAVADEDSLISGARDLARDAGVGAVLVTRGAQGMTLVAGDRAPLHVPAEARDVFDVSGAGDTVVAVAAACLAVSIELDDAVAIANAAAGIVVGKRGTASASAEEVVGALHTWDLMTGAEKIVLPDDAARRVTGWREEGFAVGFTNGCFDLLHPGHVSLIAQARGACDRLVVGLNSDQSVSRLKGPTRPIQSEAARAAVLASLRNVDLVVIFDQDTPRDLIGVLKPDVLVKGADYREEDVVGADIVKAAGGRVLLAKIQPGFSTTATIRRMAE